MTYKCNMECTIDVICKYEGLDEDHCPDSYTAKCYTCKDNRISEFKDTSMEILLLHAVFGKIPKEALKLNNEM